MKQRQVSHLWPQVAVSLLAICSVHTASAQVPSTSEDASIGQPTGGRVDLSSCDTVTPDAGVDLRPVFKEWGLSIRAQGSRGTCSVFTITGAIEYALNKRQRRATRLSIEFLNWASDQAIGVRGDGGFFSDLWKGFERYGICDEKEMPYASEFDPERRPSNAALDQARQCREAGLQLHWIKPWDPQRGLNDEQFATIKKTLRQQSPVCGGFLWPKQPKWTDGVLEMATRANVRDGHSVLLVGFRDDLAQPGGGVFLVRNSSNGPRNSALSYEYVRAYMNDAVWIGYEEDHSLPESIRD
jgi:C1A family cysteine protease